MFKAFAYLISAALLVSCGIPLPDKSTKQGRDQILDNVKIYLSQGNCSAALEEILPLYNSEYSDNTVRMSMAAVYACVANVNMFKLVADLPGSNASSNPLNFVAKEFKSTGTLNSPLDKAVESASYGIDTLMAILQPGQVLVPADMFNTSTNNPGSLLATDRTDDSNLYLIFMTMAELGGTENRYGANSAGSPTNVPSLPVEWTAALTILTYGYTDANGCAYASALVNLADALTQSKGKITGSVGNIIDTMATNVAPNVYAACVQGCQVTCGLAAISCPATCPLALRNRTACTNSNTNPSSCAAAGVNSAASASWI